VFLGVGATVLFWIFTEWPSGLQAVVFCCRDNHGLLADAGKNSAEPRWAKASTPGLSDRGRGH
jgi:hypothetical protein